MWSRVGSLVAFLVKLVAPTYDLRALYWRLAQLAADSNPNHDQTPIQTQHSPVAVTATMAVVAELVSE